MIQAHPLTGVGLGNFKPLMQRYKDPESNVTTIAHNTYLETAAELGVPALVVHLGIMGAAFITLARVRRRVFAAGQTHLHNVALGLQAGLISYFVAAFFVSTWWQSTVWVPIFLAICLHTLSRRVPRSKAPRRLEISELTEAV
jgi:O-antigen ligase